MRVYGILPRYSWDRLTVNNNVLLGLSENFFVCNLWQFRENEVLNHQNFGAPYSLIDVKIPEICGEFPVLFFVGCGVRYQMVKLGE